MVTNLSTLELIKHNVSSSYRLLLVKSLVPNFFHSPCSQNWTFVLVSIPKNWDDVKITQSLPWSPGQGPPAILQELPKRHHTEDVRDQFTNMCSFDVIIENWANFQETSFCRLKSCLWTQPEISGLVYLLDKQSSNLLPSTSQTEYWCFR